MVASLGRRLSRLFSAPDSAQEDELTSWRRKALTILIWVGLLSRVPHLYLLVAAPHFQELRPMRPLTGVLFLVSVWLGLARGMNHALRAWLYLSAVAVTATMLLLQIGLLGVGRLMLIVLPIYALVLLGRRPGLVWLGLSLSIFVVVTALVTQGALNQTLLFHEDPAAPKAWHGASLGLFQTLLTVSVLVERFLALLQRTFEAERTARQRLEVETRERQFLEVALLETSDRERKDLGRDLHDGICQQITGALLRCQVAQKELRAKELPEASHLRAIVELLDDSLSQAHDLARGLSPGDLEQGGLGPALKELARRVRETHELACEFEDDGGGGALDPAAATQLYRVAQEAVTNALKHGNPRHVWIRIRTDPAGVRLEVENDGRSLDLNNPAGMGQRIMRNRAERVGGRLELKPRAGSGVLLQCVAPLSRKVAT
ncbi:MAG TPA: sensor histidine kinase [Myxococcales bacterium]